MIFCRQSFVLQGHGVEESPELRVKSSIPSPCRRLNGGRIGPINVLIVGALVLLVLASLARHTRWINGMYVWFTVATAAIAGAAGFWRWDAARDPRMTRRAIANAINIDGFCMFITILVCIIVIVAALIVDGVSSA